MTDPLNKRSTFRLADVKVYRWVGGKHICVGLIEISLLVGLRVGAFMIGQTTLKVASNKAAKHEKRVLTINMFLCHLLLTLLISKQ